MDRTISLALRKQFSECLGTFGLAVPKLLELRVLGFGSKKDGNRAIGFLPETQKILISRECSLAGGIGIRSLRRLHLQSAGTRRPEAR